MKPPAPALAQTVGWLTRRRWSRVDGWVLLAVGWLLGSDNRIGSRIALVIVGMFGVPFAGQFLQLITRRFHSEDEDECRRHREDHPG
jgi:hypothetical protein